MLKVVHDETEANATTASTASSSLLDEIVRDGARQMLAAALQAEVAACIGAHVAEVGEHGWRLVVRNGCHTPREVTTAVGAVPVKQPRVNDRRPIAPVTGERVRSSPPILAAWCGKSAQVSEVFPLLYLHGLSTSDFARRWSSSWAPATDWRLPRSPGSPSSGNTPPRSSASGR
jgi:putative transposase